MTYSVRPAVKAVVEHLHQVGLSPKTIQNYTGHLVRAERWCEQQGTTLLEVTGDQLHTFVVEQGPSHGNRRAMRCALEHYWRVCGRVSAPVAFPPGSGGEGRDEGVSHPRSRRLDRRLAHLLLAVGTLGQGDRGSDE